MAVACQNASVVKDYDQKSKFELDPKFLAKYKNKRPKFGYNGLGELVFYRTYSRIKEDGTKETFFDTAKRVVEGCYEIQRWHCDRHHLPWTRIKAQKSAQEMFQRIWDFKFLPPGRGLWVIGTEFMWNKGGAALNNCSFISTKNIDTDFSEPFCFNMDMSMLGVGVGYDTSGANKVRIQKPTEEIQYYSIPDSREGWVESLELLLKSYQHGLATVVYDFSAIRPAGSTIHGFGGKAAGPEILCQMLNEIRDVLDNIVNKDGVIRSSNIVDIMNLIGKCIVAGNVRRTALLSLGEYDDDEYCNIKNVVHGLTPDEIESFNQVTNRLYAENRIKARVDDFDNTIDKVKLERAIETWNACNNHRWASNNSVKAMVGMDYSKLAKSTAVNGEPGYIWVDNIQNYGRMIDGRGYITDKATGVNPCAEMALESFELCTLCETFPAMHDDAADFHRTLKFAYLYAKTVTLLPTHNQKTNSVMFRNRRIGLSQSGIVQAFKKFGRRTVLKEFCDKGYKEIRRWDNTYSDWLCCPKSVKVTTVKPSGSVSLVTGSTAGIHYSLAPSRHYWRRVRIAANSPLVDVLKRAGYHVEPTINDPERTVVVKFGISEPDIETVGEISIWEQIKNSVDYQQYWSDNCVSVTVQFDKKEADQIADVLEAFDDQLKSVSFLPIVGHGYQQAPYEAATPEEIAEYNEQLKPLDLAGNINEDASQEKYCDGDVCQIRS